LRADTSPALRGRSPLSTQLRKIAAKAQQEPQARFTSLAPRLPPEFLRDTWRQRNRKGASGIDGETIPALETNLEERLQELGRRLRAGQDHAPPVRRVAMPKGNGPTRPRGLPTVEERRRQRAVARIVRAMYDPDFLDGSFGERPGRNPPMALKALRAPSVTGQGRPVYAADIQGDGTHLKHAWLRQRLARRIAAPVIPGLLGKWLNAGGMAHGVIARPEAGTPPGDPIAPCLAHVSLHDVLDLWFEKRAKTARQGEASLTRVVDDCVGVLQDQRAAEPCDRTRTHRMEQCGLTWAPDQTRLWLCGRCARARAASYGGTPGTCEFLGFKHVCGVDAKGQCAVIRIPSEKSCRQFLDSTSAWLQPPRPGRRRAQPRPLATQRKGFYPYCALKRCGPQLERVQYAVEKQWRHAIKRQSQRQRVFWRYVRGRSWFPLPQPKVLHPGFCPR
jgi:RNA-directed DNA polymerase